MINIGVIGLGYVGLSNAILLAKRNNVIAVDISRKRVSLLKEKKPSVADDLAAEILTKEPLSLEVTTDAEYAYKKSEWLVIATPTDYNPETGYFNTDSVQQVIRESINANSNLKIVIKSTIPVGFVNEMREKFCFKNIYFSPEFLREGKALYDNLYPSRIIVGDTGSVGRNFSEILLAAAEKDDVPVLLTSPVEAEAIKLFSNTYLAMRVAFFNELDSYALYNSLDAKDIIEGVSLDPRIGNTYNNPSFGYGGYCLPKDTKQLLANYSGVPNNLIRAIVEANDTRKEFLADRIYTLGVGCVGVYRLIMKSGSDNFRDSSILDIVKILKEKKIDIICYEPLFGFSEYNGIKVLESLNEFKEKSDLIITNRYSRDLDNVRDKVFSRDIFNID